MSGLLPKLKPHTKTQNFKEYSRNSEYKQDWGGVKILNPINLN